MWRWARVIAPLFLLLLSAGTTLDQSPMAHDSGILLVKGRIEAAEYVGGFAPTGPKSDEPFIDGGDYRVKLAITDVLIGKPRQPDLYLTLTITDAPPGDAHPEIFLLVKQGAEGQFQPIDWDYVSNGVCIDGDTARTYGIEKAAEAVEEKYPCK